MTEVRITAGTPDTHRVVTIDGQVVYDGPDHMVAWNLAASRAIYGDGPRVVHVDADMDIRRVAHEW